MADFIVSFRYPREVMQEAKEISAANHIDLTSYIVAALLHYIHAKAKQGEISMPDFLQPLSPRTRRRHTSSFSREFYGVGHPAGMKGKRIVVCKPTRRA